MRPYHARERSEEPTDQGVARGRAPARSRARNPLSQISETLDWRKRNLGISQVVERPSPTGTRVVGACTRASLCAVRGSASRTVDMGASGSTFRISDTTAASAPIICRLSKSQGAETAVEAPPS